MLDFISKDVRQYMEQNNMQFTDFEKASFADFTDASIKVDFIDDDGHIRHSHINPIDFERHKPQDGDEDKNVLMAGSALCSGNGSLDMFMRCYNSYKKRYKS